MKRRVPEDRVLEDRAAPDAVGEAPQREAADERARERGAVDEPLHPPVQMPDAGEDRRNEADEQDLHGDERPCRAGDDHGLPVKAGQPALAEDFLNVPATGLRSNLDCGHRHSLLGFRLTGENYG